DQETAMKLFDPHVHMTSRTTDDYAAMAAAGIAAVVEPAFWVGQPRTHVGSFEDYFLSLLGWERFRASQFGIRHFCTLAMNPREANDPMLVDGVLAQLPLARSHQLPALIHLPHRNKKRGCERTLALVREVGFSPEHTLVDHNTEETLPLTLAAGCWAGHSIYPQ